MRNPSRATVCDAQSVCQLDHLVGLCCSRVSTPRRRRIERANHVRKLSLLLELLDGVGACFRCELVDSGLESTLHFEHCGLDSCRTIPFIW
jgi:hypothetical protein